MKLVTCLFLILFSAVNLFAGIFFDHQRNAIRIKDFPPNAPCDLKQLAYADQVCGWNKVQYDDKTQTCVINSNIIIGFNDRTETVLRIGTAECPKETLIMNGNIIIYPYWIDGENKGKYWVVERRKNALVMGDPGNPVIKASLKFNCSPASKYTVYVGHLPWLGKRTHRWGGGIYIYNSELTAVKHEPGYEVGDANGTAYFSGSYVFDNAKISWVKKYLYGMNPGSKKHSSVRNTIFENIGFPQYNGVKEAYGCVFKNCGTAVCDGGSLRGKFTDCEFRDNKHNWSLTHSPWGLTCIDCSWNKPVKGDIYKAWTNKKGKIVYPKFICRRHIIVEVVDAEGKPVKDAVITIKPEQEDYEPLRVLKFAAGENGRTPEKEQKKPVLLTEFIKKATDKPNQPELKEFSFSINVDKKGLKTSVNGIKPDKSWKIIQIVLKGD